MKAKIITLVGVLLTMLLTLTSQPATAAASADASGDETSVIGLVTGTASHANTADAKMIAEDAGRSGAHVVLKNVTAGRAPATAFNKQVVGHGPNQLLKEIQRKKLQRELVRAVLSSQRNAPTGRVDVLSGIRDLSDSLHALPHRPPITDVVLFGSGLQDTPPLKLTDPVALADPETTLSAVARQGMISECKGWRVHMVGAARTPTGALDSLREVQLRELFRQMFSRCGGRLVEWSSDSLLSLPGSGTEIARARWVKKHQVMVPLPAGVLFAGDSTVLRSTAQRDLARITTVLTRTYPAATAEVAGYAASVPGGSADKARDLSLARARAVSRYLQTQGVSPSRLKAVGRGISGAVASNRTEEGRRANRRVVITCTLH
ncbi:OmpA family protein [Streptomyces sp. NPDC058307]|uniref:OmpA family protein n=1 Tax=Streptomyces sp. NPDC058307 TaxID=3346439 RepID=UPI0036E554C6